MVHYPRQGVTQAKRRNSDLAGYVGTIAIVILLGMLGGWLVYSRATGHRYNEPGYPPGWHCQQFDEGAEYCEGPGFLKNGKAHPPVVTQSPP